MVEHVALSDERSRARVPASVDQFPSAAEKVLRLGGPAPDHREVAEDGVAQRGFAQRLELGEVAGGAGHFARSHERVDRPEQPGTAPAKRA
ncbi:hypothetical protein [Saccharopolyspora sp. NPDC002376]